MKKEDDRRARAGGGGGNGHGGELQGTVQDSPAKGIHGIGIVM